MLGYYLQINSGYGTKFTDTLYQVDSTASSFEFTNLIAGAEYMFRIAAYNLIESANKQFDDEL